ncbi:MAG: hypothetical protein VB913_13155 [Rhodospirillales bacterium]|jgi:hypothetical protein
MIYGIAKMSDQQLDEKAEEWAAEMFTHTKDEKADINSVMLYSPLLQLIANEQTGRFVKKIYAITLIISVLALVVSITSVLISVS